MKVEKINNNKARIILTIEELEKRKITLKDIEFDKKKAQDFFFDILEDSNLNEDFNSESSQFFIEATTDQSDLFMVTVTKVDCIPDISKYSNNETKNKIISHFSYSVASNIYQFNSLENLYEFCIKAKRENLFVGTNSLLELDNKYFLMFSTATTKKSSFVKTFCVLSEYVDKYFSNSLLKTTFIEYSNEIIAKNAIQVLQSI